jgi:tetratricopeptide (TPR) repeat protein
MIPAQRMHRFTWLVSFVLQLWASAVLAEERVSIAPNPTDESRSNAEAAFWAGSEHYEKGEFDQAREQFQEAFRLSQDPELLYNIAQTYRLQGNCPLALATYQQFVRKGTASPLVEQAQKQVDVLKLSCPTSSAATTMPVTSDASIKETPRPPGLEPPQSHAQAGTDIRPSRMPEAKLKHNSQTWVVATLVAGLATGGVAAGLGIWNQSRYAQWQDRDRNLSKGTALGETPSAWAVRQQDNDSLWVSIGKTDHAIVALGVGAGALFATAAVLHFTTRDSKPRSAPIQTGSRLLSLRSIALGARSASLSLQGDF